ncbi:type III-B CRISPR module RAMP protein Cmr1 [Candidatus Bathyarchaeota archaeon A05DMB-2]|nr:type III-B CRISPR module RAMP protein Cmr1 [Candidatus Bathyarchaeota archaeon A05DMB-2]MBT0160439.1 type III-B CRISPR module RAMP protein Cmr1 [Candidatus Bathyarchaeota archaeon A05DMB-2]
MIEVKLRTLTPIWTGNVDRDSPSLKDTGLLGSLRFWYEAWVRALGGSACDPTSKDKCEYKGKKISICHACQLFGCAGWARKFRIECTGLETSPLFLVTSSKINQGWLKRIFEKQHNALFGQASLKITADDKDNEDVLLATLSLISKYGGLGAKTQHGFGQFLIENLDTKRVENGLSTIRSSISEKTENASKPSLSNFFISKFKIDENSVIVDYYLTNPLTIGTSSSGYGKYIPCSFDIRYKGEIQGRSFGLRNYFREIYGTQVTERIFGYGKGESRQGSKLFVSHLYKENNFDKFYYFKVWGFISPKLSTKPNFSIDLREEIIKHMQSRFKPAQAVFDKAGYELEEVSK